MAVNLFRDVFRDVNNSELLLRSTTILLIISINKSNNLTFKIIISGCSEIIHVKVLIHLKKNIYDPSFVGPAIEFILNVPILYDRLSLSNLAMLISPVHHVMTDE